MESAELAVADMTSLVATAPLTRVELSERVRPAPSVVVRVRVRVRVRVWVRVRVRLSLRNESCRGPSPNP